MNKISRILANKPIKEFDQISQDKKTSLISAIAHLIIFILVIVGLPFMGKKLQDSPHVVVEIMPISKVNNLDSKKTEETKKPEKETPKSPPVAAPEKTKEPEKKEAVKPEPVKIDTKPEPKKKEIKPEKKKKPAPEQKVLDKKNIEDYESLLKNINQSSDKKTESKNQSQNHSKINDYDQNKNLSITTENDIKRQLYACWSPPAGAKNVKDMAVIVRIKFASDGTVTEANYVDKGVFAGNQFYKAAVSAALRAVWKCSPLQIPKDEYEYWKEIEFNFDPSAIVY